MIKKFPIDNRQGSERLDDAIARLRTDLSKSEARRIIDRGGCAVNGTMVRVASRQVKAGDLIELGIMEAGRFQELLLPTAALLYEDNNLIAVNKPAGINSQRTPYQLKGTLEFWVGDYFRIHGIAEPARIVHRLDRGTSGVMLFPKHKRSAAWLSSLFHDGLIDKRYLALVSGRPAHDSWTVEGAIGKIAPARYGVVAGGKPAVTEFSCLSFGERSLVEARPLTGRTHQIRVHLQSCGLSIIGDTTYGTVKAERMMLHCSAMTFRDESGKEIRVSAPLDGVFEMMATS
ncbi:MAG: RluA family pseudouridine synthase [Desulfuromonadales bacterium]